MLIELKVSNFSIIENLHIHFKPGLNILSGETGAGKSVLLKSLGLLMGEKAFSDEIRSGCTTASIEGIFDLEKRGDISKALLEHDIPNEDKTLVVRRTVSSNEKSRVYLNGVISNVNNLKELISPLIEVAGHGAPLIEMTGQHDSKHLLSKSYHLDLLDQYASVWELRNRVQNLYSEIHTTRILLGKIDESEKFRHQRIDYLVFQKNELSSLNLKPGEDQELELEIRRHKGAHKISAFVDLVERLIYDDEDSANSRIDTILKQASDLKNVDSVLFDKASSFQNAKSLLESTFFELRSYASKVEFDPERLEEMEQQLSALRKLQKKYGSTIEEILGAKQKIEVELTELLDSDDQRKVLETKLGILANEYNRLADMLHTKRTEAATTIGKKVNLELLDLNMKGVTFHVSIEKMKTPSSTGLSDVEFQSQTSEKDPRRSLAKFASGGELSRILLSLKRVVGSGKYPRTYLFDEVDSGVSGQTAEKVGKKLAEISKGQQVICVTHLPQVAAFGHHHFYIEKAPQRGLAVMMVTELNGKKRVEEIARLISGEKITKTSIAHAEQLLTHS